MQKDAPLTGLADDDPPLTKKKEVIATLEGESTEQSGALAQPKRKAMKRKQLASKPARRVKDTIGEED